MDRERQKLFREWDSVSLSLGDYVAMERLRREAECIKGRFYRFCRREGAGFKPRPGGIDLTSKVCNILRPRPFSLRSIRGLGDFHNDPASNFPSDSDNRESKLFPRLLEPIHESFPSGLEHIPVAVEDNDVPVLER